MQLTAIVNECDEPGLFDRTDNNLTQRIGWRGQALKERSQRRRIVLHRDVAIARIQSGGTFCKER